MRAPIPPPRSCPRMESPDESHDPQEREGWLFALRAEEGSGRADRRDAAPRPLGRHGDALERLGNILARDARGHAPAGDRRSAAPVGRRVMAIDAAQLTQVARIALAAASVR